MIVRQSPESSALYRALHPDEAEWSLDRLLLADVADSLNIANWQRGSGKKRDFPKPIPRPGIEPDEVTYGKGAIPLDQMAEFLGWT